MSSHAVLAPTQSPTRNQERQTLLRQARAVRIMSTVLLPSLDRLQLFVTLATINSVIGLAVHTLTISLPLSVGYPAHLIRECLRLTPNLDTLVLVLPTFSPVTVLNGITLPRLQVLSTNIQHRALPPFLALHPWITGLILASCGSRTRHCPLRNLPLAHISNLHCPARCLEGIAHGQVQVATVNLTRLASMAAFAIQALSTSPLYSLSVEFFSDDYDILSRIIAAAPRLRKLKLVEKPRNQRRFHHARRPWNDLHEWHRMLMRLPFLEELMLRTTCSVTGPRRSEHLVINSWANGTTQRSGRHPNLFHISILQRSSVANTQALSHWFRRHGIWARVNVAGVGPADSFTMA